MVKVNLLPPEERTKKQVIKENVIAIFLSLIALGLIIGFSFFLIFFESNELAGKVKNAEDEVTLQKEENDKYKDIETIIEDLNKNIERIKKLEKKNIEWSSALNEIRQKTPVEIVLQELSVSSQNINTSSQKTTEDQSKQDKSAEEQNKQTQSKETKQMLILTIKGLSDNETTVMKLKEALSTYSLFEYVDFESSSWSQEKKKYDFILKAKLKI